MGSLEEHKDQASRAVPEALKALGYNAKLGSMLTRRGYVTTLPDGLDRSVLVVNGVLVAGEAAGFITRNWGEGVYSALVSGELAARNYNDVDGYRRAVERVLVPFLAERLERARGLYRL